MKLLTALSFVAIMSQHIIIVVLIFIFSLDSLVEAVLPENGTPLCGHSHGNR